MQPRTGELQVSDWTLHIIADKDLRWSHFTFASQYVADQLVDRLLEGARRELELFLSSSRGRPELAQIRACLFESFVHHVLPLGGVFEQRDLDTGESHLKMPQHAHFSQVGGLPWHHVPDMTL